jgi:predicted phage-related endonuclease
MGNELRHCEVCGADHNGKCLCGSRWDPALRAPKTKTFGAAVVLGEFATHSAEWHAARGLGASSLAVLACHAIADNNPEFPRPSRSVWEIWAEAIGERTERSRSEDNERAMRLGNDLEPIILREYALKWGGNVTPYKASLRHPEHEWMTCNLDGVEWNGETPVALLECKRYHPSQLKHWDDDGVPLVIQAQSIAQQECTGVHAGWVVGLFANKLKRWPVVYDKADAEWMVEVGARFWHDHVLTRTPPEIDASQACADWILRKWSKGSGKTVDLDAEAGEWAERYAAASKAERAAEKERKEAGNQLLEIMGPAKKGLWDGGSVSRTRPYYFDREAFQADHPDIYEEFRNFEFDEREFREFHPHLYETYKTIPGKGSVRVYPKKTKTK